MFVRDLILQNRSRRRFDQGVRMEMGTLEELVDLARHSASARNLQPLKYILSNDPDVNEKIFKTLAWAVDLPNWSGPAPGERPAAYIIILGDTALAKSFDCDCGIAAQSMMLGAVEKGFGGCMLGSIQRKELRQALNVPEGFKILLALALGKPDEKVVVETVPKPGEIENCRYWRDENGVHHVPKRPLSELTAARFSE